VTPEENLEAWDWPNREASQFPMVGSQRWHLQRTGNGPGILLLHGTGSSLHSWSGLLPLLRERHEVLAVDLPGHGFSAIAEGRDMSLPGMAGLLGSLLRSLEFNPTLVAGHSAGAAILARMCLDGLISPRTLVSINGAMLALPGLTGAFFSGSARLLAAIPAVPSWVAGFGGRRAFTERLIEGTGSILDATGVEYYRRLVSQPGHVAAALKMMASWDLAALERDLPGLSLPVHLLACENDRTVPPAQSEALAELLTDATLHIIPGLGHLGHEERPDLFATLLTRIAEGNARQQ
jgi:magnesium chelatase accessory protein